MRMWMVDPKIMCRQHLLGEHFELHMFEGAIKKGVRLTGYLLNNLLEIDKIKARHDELVNEMVERGYNHKTPITRTAFGLPRVWLSVRINRLLSLTELLIRCERCRKKYYGREA